MFHSNTNGEGFDTDGSTLAAGLLTSAAILSDDPGYQWRRGITAYITACIAASRFISFKETTYYYEINNSFSSRSSRDEETSSSSCDRVSESPVNLSTLSQVSIDIPSDNEAEEKNEDEQLLLRNKAAQIVEERDQISLVINMSTDNEAEEKNEEQLLLRNKAAQIVEERDQISLVINRSSDNEVEENNGEQPRLRNEVAQIVKERDLISLKDFGGVEKVASIFDSDLKSGIRSSIQEPEVRNSYRDSNPIHTKEFVFSLLKAGNNYTIFLLVVSAGLSFGTEIMEEGPKYGWHDGVVILAAVSMLIAFPSVANFLRTRKLEKERNKLNVKVVRRQEQDITISNLVPGDIVCLKKGDLVPADGLVVNSGGLELDGVLNSKIDHDRNPFLFFGSKVKEGHGKMLATSVGDQTELAELLSSAIQDPIEKTLLEDQIEKINTYVENLSLLVSIFIASVAFIRLLCRRHVGVVDNELPELKGKVSVDMLMKIFEKIVLKPHGKASILASALTVVVIAIQHGMPFVITISLSFWNSKMVKNQAGPQNFSACATMGIVTVMCIDVTGGLVCKDLEVNKFWIGGKDLKDDTDSEIDPPEPQIKTAVKAFKKAGVRIKLVSEEELPAVRAIACELGILSPESDDLVALALELGQIRNLEPPEMMKKMSQMTVIGGFVAKEKLSLVQYMQQKGEVVAFFGGSLISNTPALKTADIGIIVDTSCTMASESSDIIIKAIGSLSTSLKFGRCAYHNIKMFSQLQLTVCISGLLITLVTAMGLKESSITALQLIWVNWITCILGGLMMVMELQVEELIANPPANRTKSLLTKAMCKNIALQVLCQASVLLIFQFKGQVIPGMNQDVRKAMIFSSFTISQVFNLFYAMNLVKKEVFLSVLRNFWFLLALVTVMIMQVLVAEYLKSLADCVRLNWIQWCVCFLLAALPCGIHIAVEFISYFFLNWSLESNGLQTLFSRRRPQPYLLSIGIPFSVFIFFTVSYNYNPFIGKTLR